jgi:hypothetical protein
MIPFSSYSPYGEEVFASNLKLAPWNRELGSIGRVVDEQNTPGGEGDHTSCIPQGERS